MLISIPIFDWPHFCCIFLSVLKIPHHIHVSWDLDTCLSTKRPIECCGITMLYCINWACQSTALFVIILEVNTHQNLLSFMVVLWHIFAQRLHWCMEDCLLSLNLYYYRCNNYVDSNVCFYVNAWAWRQKHSHLNCLIAEGSTWNWDNCLLFMFLLWVVIEWKTCCCGSTMIENSKQKKTKHR